MNLIRDKDNNPLTVTEHKLRKCAEPFHEVVNCAPPLTCVPEPEVPVKELIDIAIDQITRFEIKAALKTVKDNKAAGMDDLPGELLKVNPERTMNELSVLERGVVPRDWTQGAIVKVPKKGDLSYCKNWRSITLLSVTSKIFGTILIHKRLALTND